MKTRERYWGLYDYVDEDWLTDGVGDPTTAELWSKTPTKRRRFSSPNQAKKFAAEHFLHSDAIPCPFYVTRRRSEKLTPEAKAVIEVAREIYRTGQLSCTYGQLTEALKRYDEATK